MGFWGSVCGGRCFEHWRLTPVRTPGPPTYQRRPGVLQNDRRVYELYSVTDTWVFAIGVDSIGSDLLRLQVSLGLLYWAESPSCT